MATLLNAKWQRTPFLLEAAEFLASENKKNVGSDLNFLLLPLLQQVSFSYSQLQELAVRRHLSSLSWHDIKISPILRLNDD